MKDIEVKIPCEDLILEGKWYCPGGEGPFPVVTICHPHPLYGGNFRNNVVRAVYWALAAQSLAVLRFNFRGVGASGGVYGGGTAEVRDVRAAVDFALKQPKIDVDRAGLAGYSFGGGMSVPAAGTDSRIRALALVSPMLDDAAWDMLGKLSIPKLVVTGSEDTYFPVSGFEANIGRVAAPQEFIIVPGPDHFWQGYEAEIADTVGRFFVGNL